MPANAGSNVTEAVEVVAAEIVSNHGLREVPVFVEHHPPETTDGETETFDLIVFAHEEVR